MEINVSNMPMNKLYKFADNSFVWSVMLSETRGGNYKQNTPTKFTEVYRVDGTGFMIRAASGRLVDNPAINDFNHRFSVFDYDNDMELSFFVEMPLKEATLDDLYMLRDSIARSYEEKNSRR